MLSAVNARWKRSMSVCTPSQPHSWHSLGENASLTARHSVAFSPLLSSSAGRGVTRAVSRRPAGSASGEAGGLWDRQGTYWQVFDIDGTRQAARQRALPCTSDRPPVQRRLSEVCAPGYTGRKRGEVVRTRTTILQAHTHQWVGTFSGAGNGDYRGELRQAVKAISGYVKAQSLPLSQAVIRLDGQYGNGAILVDLAGFAYIMRGKDYDLLDLPDVQARLTQLPDQKTCAGYL
jgi:hypothetical protein